MSWYNNDGLYVRFGTEKTVAALGGEDSVQGNTREIVIDFDYADLGAVGVNKIMSEGVTLPSGAFLKSAELQVITAFASASNTATLGIGLVDTDRTTEWDFDGIDAAIAEAALVAKATIACDGTLVETTLSNSTPGYVTMTVGTEAFTSGKGQLRLTYFHPAA